MDANTLYEGLFTNDGLPILVIVISLPILFVFFFPIIGFLFGAICTCVPMVFLSFMSIVTSVVSMFFQKPKETKMVITASLAKPSVPQKSKPVKKSTQIFNQIESDVAHGLKGLGLTLKDAKTLVKKVTEKNTYSDTVSLMNACLQAINTR